MAAVENIPEIDRVLYIYLETELYDFTYVKV